MKTKKKTERTLFLKRTYQELIEMTEKYGATYSIASVKFMKLIVKRLQYEIYLAEMENIRKEVTDGKLTPKAAVKKKAAVRKFSSELVIDVDGCQGRARELLQLLKVQPWVRAGWISVSDDGFKVVVRVDAETPFEFEKQAYPQVATRVQDIIGFPVDKQCKDLTRMCYVSWDEDAFWNEDCEVFPWRENLSDSLGPEEPDVSKNPDSIEESSPSSTSKGKVSEAHGFIAHFFERFCRTHAFVPGSRHDFLLKLGASARRNGMNLKELDELIELAEPFCLAPDYAPGEVSRNITESYHFTENRMADEAEVFGVKGHYRHHVRTTDGISEEEGTDADKEEMAKEQARMLRMEADCLPDWIYDELLDLLRKGVGITANKRQRDMLLLSMLTNLRVVCPMSGCCMMIPISIRICSLRWSLRLLPERESWLMRLNWEGWCRRSWMMPTRKGRRSLKKRGQNGKWNMPRRYRKRLLDMQIIVQQEDKYGFYTRRWRAKLEKVSPR